jgi:hypothetical protein
LVGCIVIIWIHTEDSDDTLQAELRFALSSITKYASIKTHDPLPAVEASDTLHLFNGVPERADVR